MLHLKKAQCWSTQPLIKKFIYRGSKSCIYYAKPYNNPYSNIKACKILVGMYTATQFKYTL